MSKMSKLKDKIKSKVKLDDLHVDSDKATSPHNDKSVNQQSNKVTSEYGDMSPNTQVAKSLKKQVTKTRLTIYLDAETETLFNQMYANKIVKGEKVDKSAMVCEAISVLHKNWNQ